MSQGQGSMQEKAQYHLSNLDKELSKYPALNNFEQQTSVPKVYVALGLGALYFFLVFFNIAGEFLVNTAGFALPAYYSMEALFSVTPTDDQQWLTYWIVYAFLTVLESLVNAVYWFPFYYTFKFVFIMYMALPQTQGAQVVFRSVIQPLFARFFEGGSESANLRSAADKATGKSLQYKLWRDEEFVLVHSINCKHDRFDYNLDCSCWTKWLNKVPPFSLADEEEVPDPDPVGYEAWLS